MDVFGLQHRINILYREDSLNERMFLLYSWMKTEDISFNEFKELVNQCNESAVGLAKRRRGVV